MTRNRVLAIVLLASAMMVGAVAITNRPQAEAQLIDIDVDGAGRVVIGEEPVCVERGVYSLRRRWVPRKLAVYLDGKRLQRGVDYREDVRDREIEILCKTTDRSVVIVDYLMR